MRRVVLPARVEIGLGKEQREPDERQRDGYRPGGGVDATTITPEGPSDGAPNLWGVAVLLLLVAIGADAVDSHQLAFYLLLGAVVTTAHAALDAYGRLVELPGRAPGVGVARLRAALAVLALALVLVAAAVRAPALADGAVPQVGLSALVASLALLVLHGALRVAAR